MTRILILTGDPIGAKMAGPAIRSWNMAIELSKENEVTLVTTTRLDEGVSANFALQQVRPGENERFGELERWADVILFQGYAMRQFAVLRTTDRVVVADIYDPMHLEMLEQGREQPRATWELGVSNARDVLNEQLARADFFLCASERQRLFYLGHLASLGRISPATYTNDPNLERLLAVVPFGLSSTPPVSTGRVLKGVVPGIDPDDFVVIWGGGLYSWFDPKTLIHAVAAVATRHPRIKLFFLGTRHPGVAEMGIVRESFDLARELGALDRSVFFNDTWVDFAERQNYLLESEVGVSTHLSHVETEFAFRTRILDYLWAGLPIVATEGDSFADLIASEGLGIVVPAADEVALSAALERMVVDAEFVLASRANVDRVRKQFYWERTLAPLLDFVREPLHAADYPQNRVDTSPVAGRVRKPYGLRHDLSMTWHYLVNSGPSAVFSRIRGRLSKRR
ncbi:MAG TPA: glycosyltransferase family 4 protein [Galbitalea sp.]